MNVTQMYRTKIVCSNDNVYCLQLGGRINNNNNKCHTNVLFVLGSSLSGHLSN